MNAVLRQGPGADPRDIAAVDATIESRRSARAFTSQPVPRETVHDILRVASRAPSGANTQPWKVYVVGGAVRERIVRETCAAHDAFRDHPSLRASLKEGDDYYPERWISPYIDRRRENGLGLYGVLGISRGEKDRMHAQHQRNFRFFDAPVGLLFTLNDVMGRGSLVDYGGFLSNITIAAHARGLGTCVQAAWNGFGRVVLPILGASTDETLVCGMALGHADPDAAVNGYRTPRVPVNEFTTWLDSDVPA